VAASVMSAVSASATSPAPAGEKPAEEGVELSQAVLGYIDRDLLVVARCRAFL
jgi:hypothetical protein